MVGAITVAARASRKFRSTPTSFTEGGSAADPHREVRHGNGRFAGRCLDLQHPEHRVIAPGFDRGQRVVQLRWRLVRLDPHARDVSAADRLICQCLAEVLISGPSGGGRNTLDDRLGDPDETAALRTWNQGTTSPITSNPPPSGPSGSIVESGLQDPGDPVAWRLHMRLRTAAAPLRGVPLRSGGSLDDLRDLVGPDPCRARSAPSQAHVRGRLPLPAPQTPDVHLHSPSFVAAVNSAARACLSGSRTVAACISSCLCKSLTNARPQIHPSP